MATIFLKAHCSAAVPFQNHHITPLEVPVNGFKEQTQETARYFTKISKNVGEHFFTFY